MSFRALQGWHSFRLESLSKQILKIDIKIFKKLKMLEELQ